MYASRYALPLLCFAALALAEHEALAQDWGPSGVVVCGEACRTLNHRVVPDGVGGAFIAWEDERNIGSSGADTYVHRITSEGSVAPGWPQDGFLVHGPVTSQNFRGLSTDGQGGVFVVWMESRGIETSFDLYVQRIGGDGTIAAGWPPMGVPAVRAPSLQFLPVLANDGTGGAFIAWSDFRHFGEVEVSAYIQHLLASGEVQPGWPENGLRLVPHYATPGGVIADGEGGVIVVWGDGRRGLTTETFDLYLQRLRPDGTIAPGWPEHGKLAISMRSQPQLVAAEGGFYLVSRLYDFAEINDDAYTVQRFTMDGETAQGWPSNGLDVCDVEAQSRTGLRTSSDGMGGVLVGWFDARSGSLGYDIWGSRVLPSGELTPGWPEDGLLVSRRGCCAETLFDLCSDGAGGAYFVWEWSSDFFHPSLIQHIRADGTVGEGWPEYGRELAPGAQYAPQVAAVGNGAAIAVWEERGGGGTRTGLYANRFSPNGPVSAQVTLSSVEATAERVVLVWYGREAVESGARVERMEGEGEWQEVGTAEAIGDGTLRFEDASIRGGERYGYRLAYARDGRAAHSDAVWVEVPQGVALHLEGFAPNPARGVPVVSFTLEDDEPAQLEVFDARGRRVESLSVGDRGAGRHWVGMPAGANWKAGVYWIRLSQGARTLTARGVRLP